MPWSQLHFVTSRRLDLYPYRTFQIPKKSGGVRSIQAPAGTVKILQRKLLEALTLVYTAHPSAHGFVPERSIVTNAERHERARLVLNIDIEDFFPSVESARVRGVFMKRFGFPRMSRRSWHVSAATPATSRIIFRRVPNLTNHH